MGATWFLGALFVVSVVYKLMDYYMPSVKEKYISCDFIWMCCSNWFFN